MPINDEETTLDDQESADETRSDPPEIISTVPRNESWIEMRLVDDEWGWLLWAMNGRPLAMSARGYKRRHDAIRTIRQVGDTLADPDLTILAQSQPRGELKPTRPKEDRKRKKT
jgi:uncharacterized protein YegP (UPF0339 family)